MSLKRCVSVSVVELALGGSDTNRAVLSSYHNSYIASQTNTYLNSIFFFFSWYYQILQKFPQFNTFSFLVCIFSTSFKLILLE